MFYDLIRAAIYMADIARAARDRECGLFFNPAQIFISMIFSKISGASFVAESEYLVAHVAGIVDNDNLLVDQRCSEVLSCLDQYQWDPNPNLAKEKPKHNRAAHMDRDWET